MSLWIIIDLILIGIYVFMFFHFKGKGFIKASETVVSLILTLCLMTSALPVFENFIAGSALGESIGEKVEEALVAKEAEEPESEEEKSSILPSFLQDAVDDKLEDIEEAKNNALLATAKETTRVIIQVISVILLFILVKLFIFLLFKILNIVSKLPGLNFVNRTLGAVMGIINATILVYFLCAILAVMIPAEASLPIREAIEDTYLTKYFYDNNMLMRLFIR